MFNLRKRSPQHESPLRITEVISARELDPALSTSQYGYMSPNLYRVAADRPLWKTLGEIFTGAAVTLERTFTPHPTKGPKIPYQIAYHHDESDRFAPPNPPAVEEDNQIWITSVHQGDHEPPTADNLNAIIAASPTPDVRFVHSVEHPGLLRAHRSIKIGNYAANAVGALPSVQATTVWGTHKQSGIPYSTYPDRTLLDVVVEPGIWMKQAEADVRTVLTI